MKTAELLRSTSFRLSLVYMVLFAGSVLLLLGFLYWSTVGYMADQTDATIDAEIVGLAEQYREGGLGNLVNILQERVARDPDSSSVYLLASPTFTPLAGNIDAWPNVETGSDGWLTFAFRDTRADDRIFQARAQPFVLKGGLHLLVGNVSELGGSWEGSASISLFLSEAVDDQQAETIRQQIALHADIAEARLIDRDRALEEFRRLSGFGEAIDLLDQNPLPAVVLVRPGVNAQGTDAVAALARELQDFREIELAQVDLQWVERLGAITGMIERAVMILAVLLAGAVLLIVGNTVRLEIQNRHSEIEIVKLVGGTDAFIRRPFL